MAASHGRDYLAHTGQSYQDTSGPIRPMVHPKHAMTIGNWNARTNLHRSGNVAQAARDMNRRDVDIMGISKTHWIGQGKMQLRNGATIVYSGRDNNIHREGVGILMSKSAAA